MLKGRGFVVGIQLACLVEVKGELLGQIENDPVLTVIHGFHRRDSGERKARAATGLVAKSGLPLC